ncbi:MAG TPA: glycosyltransferase family 2 protein, partial [Oligoflexia bacterium]|nr:glycosyltransferase family 2 protein [Oligoflexia bacterium]
MAYFSIIVPAYNAQQTLARCLEPVCAQLLSCPSPGEVIVVDNNSTDQTAAIARSFSVRVLRCAERGRARARNAGIRAAQGEWIATVDADTVVDANWLS